MPWVLSCQNGNGHDIHRFREKNILTFIKHHPQEINLGKVDQMWFLDLVLLRGTELHDTTVSSEVDDGSEVDEAAWPLRSLKNVRV